MLQGDSASPARFLAFINPALVIVNRYGRGIKSPAGGTVTAVCAVDDTILYANNQQEMQETTNIYVDWLNFVKMEANVEKCIHIRSIPRELKTEGLERQLNRKNTMGSKRKIQRIGGRSTRGNRMGKNGRRNNTRTDYKPNIHD